MKKIILGLAAVFAAGLFSLAFAGPSLQYSTYLGTSVEDEINAMCVDAAGNVYMTGQTATVADKFPGTAGHYQTSNAGGAFDAFVIKLNPAGAIVWATYLGGGGTDIGKSIAVDASGIVYVCGSTTSAGAVFPSTVGAYKTVNAGGTDGFLTAIAADGNSLVYSTFLGGAGEDFCYGIAVNSAGTAYVTGGTTSDNSTWASTPGAYQLTNNTGNGATHENAFVAKFNAAGAIQFFTYLGGSVVGGVHGNAIAIDGIGNSYVTGVTRDTFPITPTGPSGAFKQTIGGANDTFVAKINASGTSLLYSTYLGGSGMSEGFAIKLDATGNVYIAGDNNSDNFPDAVVAMPKVGQSTIAGGPYDGFIMKMKLNATGHNDGVYCTFLGGKAVDHINALAVDSYGNAYVTGRTASDDFVSISPASIQTPLDSTFGAVGKAFLAVIGPDGSTRVLNTYIGGVSDQAGTGVGLDAANNIYVSGWTSSSAATFPLAVPLYAALNGPFDGFVMKISPAALGLWPTITKVSPNVGPDSGGTTVVITGTGFSGVAFATGVQFGLQNAASYTVNSDNQITAVTGAQAAQVVDVKVTNSLGSSPAVPADSYTFFLTSGGSGDCDPFIFPSPTKGSTAGLGYCMATAGVMRARVYNQIGDMVAVIEERRPAGAQGSTLDVSKLAPGVYFCLVKIKYDNGLVRNYSKIKFAITH